MNRDLILMAASLFTWGVGEGMFIYFQSLYLQKWGADPVEIGAILGGMGVSMVLAQAPAGWLADRVGSRPVMWSSWILGCLSAGIMALAGSLEMFVAGLLLYGLTSFVVAPMNSYITSVRGKLSVERALNYVSATFHLGTVMGPVVGGMIGETYGLAVVYRISAVIFLVSTAIVLIVRKPPLEQAEAPAENAALQSLEMKRGLDLTKNPRFAGLLVMISLTMLALYLPQPFTPNYLQNQHGLTLTAIGQLGAMNGLGNALIMLVFGHLRAPVGFVVGQALVVLFTLLMWQGNHVIWFGAGYFFFGGYRLCRSMALAFARTLVRASETGFAYGLVETSNAIAVILAPLAAGWIYAGNPQGIYIAGLAAGGIMILANLVWLRKPEQKPALAKQAEGKIAS